jgi:hypothetical protein
VLLLYSTLSPESPTGPRPPRTNAKASSQAAFAARVNMRNFCRSGETLGFDKRLCPLGHWKPKKEF